MEKVKDIFLSNLEKKLLYGGKATQKLEEKQQESEKSQIHLGNLTREQKLIILDEFNKSKYVSFSQKRPKTERNDRYQQSSLFQKSKESVLTPNNQNNESKIDIFLNQLKKATLLTEKQPTPQTLFSKVIQEHNFQEASSQEYQIKTTIGSFKAFPREMFQTQKSKFLNSQDTFDWKVQQLINTNLEEMNEKLKGKTNRQIATTNLEFLKTAHAKEQEQFYQRVFMPTNISYIRSSPSYLKFFSKPIKTQQSISSEKPILSNKSKGSSRLHKPRTKSIFNQD